VIRTETLHLSKYFILNMWWSVSLKYMHRSPFEGGVDVAARSNSRNSGRSREEEEEDEYARSKPKSGSRSNTRRNGNEEDDHDEPRSNRRSATGSANNKKDTYVVWSVVFFSCVLRVRLSCI
jgi:hypothetical protein